MRKLFSLAVCVMAVTCAMAQKTVNVEAGGLAQAVGGEKLTITNLKVVGNIDASDIRVLREMAGHNSKGQLAQLDLSEANILKGGGAYANVGSQPGYTQKNKLTALMFFGCHSLESITLPDRAVLVASDAFLNCPNLKEILTHDNHKFTSIDGVLYKADTTIIIRVPEGKHVSSFNIPEGVKQIYSSCFRNHNELTEVYLPSTMEGINDNAFTGCPNLAKVVINRPAPPAMENAFSSRSIRIVVPKGSAARYKSVEWWKNFTNITE
ncbi:MAG: leucine-rich repeat domain-containing protein [Prevotella sp.]|nr:leucine-rich repeat domain-containing protein [Prevotella sp.]MCR5152924.1 leucine-rich repeat domain-containing protein [Prevotella sp.]